jgi:hypothetical protein
MHSLEEITRVENRYVSGGERALGEAFSMLQVRWMAGMRDRETCLRLAFLAWYACAEPAGLTELPNDDQEVTAAVFSSALEGLGGERTSDAEACYALGLMATMFPWAISVKDEAHWQHVGEQLSARSRLLAPDGFSPPDFSGRGAYGHYFSHMTKVRES